MSKRMHDEIQSEHLSVSKLPVTDTPGFFLGFAFSKRRFQVFYLFFVIALCILGTRAFYLQVMQYAHYQELAEQNRVRHVYVWPKRGVIRDRQGVVLSDNIPR